LTAIARPETPARRRASSLSTTDLSHPRPSALLTPGVCGADTTAAVTHWPLSCEVMDGFVRTICPSCVTVTFTCARIACGDGAAGGTLTARPRWIIMESVTTMPNTRTRQITWISA